MKNAMVGRQPILDKNENLFAYELLFRSPDDNRITDGEKATAEVIINSLESIGLSNLTQNKPAFINFTSKMIKNKIFDILSSESIYIEILETVEVDKKIIEICKELKSEGFKIVLDDFEFEDSLIELIKMADIIKIDFLNSTKKVRKATLNLIKSKYNQNVKFLAEKIEDYSQFQEAKEFNYDYYQGFYFTKPDIVSGKKVEPFRLSYVNILEELNKENPNFREIEKNIKQDLSMSYSLLRLVNSAAYGYDINSIRQGIVILGVDKLKKWSLLYSFKSINSSKPDILLKTSLIRAYFAESLKKHLNIDEDLFILGMFSLIDAYLDRNLEEILSQISMKEEFKEALISKEGKLGDVLKIIDIYEKSNWKSLKEFSLKPEILFNDYLKAIEKAEEIFEIT
ncbi:EAL and HDOD domain-containing protein [Halanaerobium congolense]|jgi:EAL and modified HD-GYP domain-containing signal transduction protein|uniref:Diguanylate phosphodiesterase n=1 Tax=Halanaerobium congolense TaxID=54121 RepID=A0A1G6JRW8_9FIRM|nr:HDOD domain-containing protein [Halanaerobium congolense]SDC21490.1 diguanylate phosphodiesterase [Halanaerobium congolense]SDK42636.1 diguanylate phosphodiesterase [Halanaerobium congolense]SDM97823.1 diguanylate phosphodiesterase [Halanaerobium congolense]